MKAPRYDVDVCVIGAGPAGSVTAQRLCDLGYHVCIVEAKAFPRPNVGICLSDESYPLIDYLGLRKEVEAAEFFQRKTTMVKWGKESPEITPQPGVHVDRGVFDQILLRKAQSKGADLIQPARVQRLNEMGDGWMVKLNHSGEVRELHARFVVDAAGNSNVLPSKKMRMAPALSALYATWSLSSIPKYDGFIEAGEDTWLWFAQLSSTEASITLFTDPKHFSKSENTSLSEHYSRMLKQFSLLEQCQLNELKSEVKSCDASSRASSNPVSIKHIKVGDANMSVDPIASQGVHLAISSALQAAIVVNTVLKRPENANDAIAFYQNSQQERIKRYTEKTASVYRQVVAQNNHVFWKVRSESDVVEESQNFREDNLPNKNCKIQLSSFSRIKTIPVMEHDIIATAPALFHPILERPVAYLGGKQLVPLLSDIDADNSIDHILQQWSGKMPKQLGTQIMSWLWQHRIVELTN